MDNDLLSALLPYQVHMTPDDKPDRPSVASDLNLGCLVVAIASVLGFLLRYLLRSFP